MDNLTFQNELLEIQPKLLSFAYRLTSDREDARDLAQETSLKILNSASKFINEQNFKGWSLTIMKNIFINNYRKAAKRKTVNNATGNEDFLDLTTRLSQETPDGMLSAKEIGTIINMFPSDFRIALKYYLSGYSYQEIAETMNIPLGTVKSRLFCARKKLQELLRDFR